MDYCTVAQHVHMQYHLISVMFHHWYRNDVEGGTSIMLDIVPVISELRTKFPHHFATLTEVPATFSRFRTQRCVTSLQIQNLWSLICNHVFQNISCNFGVIIIYDAV